MFLHRQSSNYNNVRISVFGASVLEKPPCDRSVWQFMFCFIECFFSHVRPSTLLGFLYDEARTPFRTFKRDFCWSKMITVVHLASLINAPRPYHLAISCPF